MKDGVRGCVYGAWCILRDEKRLDAPTDRFPYGTQLHRELDAAYAGCRKDVDDLPRVVANAWLAVLVSTDERNENA